MAVLIVSGRRREFGKTLKRNLRKRVRTVVAGFAGLLNRPGVAQESRPVMPEEAN